MSSAPYATCNSFVMTNDHRETCTLPSCDTTTGLQKCGRCKAALYCSKKCQTEDFSLHKQLCRSAADAHTCSVCQIVGEALSPAIPLHYTGRDPVKEILDQSTETYALVFHATFSPRLSQSMRRVAPSSGRYDLIVQYGQAAHVGMAERTTMARMRRVFAKSDEGEAKEACKVLQEALSSHTLYVPKAIDTSVYRTGLRMLWCHKSGMGIRIVGQPCVLSIITSSHAVRPLIPAVAIQSQHQGYIRQRICKLRPVP